jgi:hypothetical protein
MRLWIVETLLDVDLGCEVETGRDILVEKRVDSICITDITLNEIELRIGFERCNISMRSIR